MDDTFETRLALALAIHDMSRAAFAAALGKDGQQKLTNWLGRGRIGQPSVALVRQVLPRVSMEWLNEGVGSPTEQGPGTPATSQSVGLDLAKLQTSVEYVVGTYLALGKPVNARGVARLSLGVYELLIGDEPTNIIELSDWLKAQVRGEGNVGQGKAGSVDKNVSGGVGRQAAR